MAPEQPDGVSATEIGQANGRRAGICVPIRTDAWASLAQPLQDELLWFHRHVAATHMTNQQAEEALGYDSTTIYRVLTGAYAGSWDNVVSKIRNYRAGLEAKQQLAEARKDIKTHTYAENGIYRLVARCLDYAQASHKITTISGDSRTGKTEAAKHWREDPRHFARSVFVRVPATGGVPALVKRLAKCLGIRTHKRTAAEVLERIIETVNGDWILIADEAHRLIPDDKAATPVMLEVLRDIVDETGCALALIATLRFERDMRQKDRTYVFEQVLGRMGPSPHIPGTITKANIKPIVKQYFEAPTDEVLDLCFDLANKPGRLGVMADVLQTASMVATKRKETLVARHLYTALAIRERLAGAGDTQDEKEEE